MPETPSSRGRGSKVKVAKHRPRSSNTEMRDNTEANGNTQDRTEERVRGQPILKQGQTSREDSDTEDELKDHEPTDTDGKLIVCLLSCLADCSRQRLRALHMTLRHYGNVDNRVSLKDFQASLQANQVKLTQRAHQMITEVFEDAQGLDYEQLYQCLSRAHARTGRDSIKARNRRNYLRSKPALTIEETDSDFLRRLEEHLVRDQTYFDVEVLRLEFGKWDLHSTGKINKEGAYLICSEKTPLYGALLKNLIHRCDEDKGNNISWPLFLHFLETAQASAWQKHPELSSLPEKERDMTSLRIATPEPIDELANSTKVKVVNKLLKKNPVSDQTSDASRLGEYKLMALHRQIVASEEGALRDLTSLNDDPELVSLRELLLPSLKTGLLEKSDSSNEKREGSARGRSRANQTEGTDAHDVTDGRGYDKRQHVIGQSGTESLEDITVKDMPYISKKEVTVSKNEISVSENEVYVSKNEVYFSKNEVSVSKNSQDTAGVLLGDQVSGQETQDTHKLGLQLEWVYGYRGHDCSCNLKLLASGEIIYFIASTIVIYNIQQHQQRHYREHTGIIQSLDVHSRGTLVASGQCQAGGELGHTAHVRVWLSDTLQTLHVLGQDGVLIKSVSALCFMPSSNILACVDGCPDQYLSTWDTNTGVLLARTQVPSERLRDLEFNPQAPDSLSTCGKEHLAWWRVEQDSGSVSMLSGPNYQTFLRGCDLTCLCHNQRGQVVTGNTAGAIQIWDSMAASLLYEVKHGHQGPVLDLLSYGGHILSAGQDRAISCWAMGKNLEKEVLLQLPISEGCARCLLLVSPEHCAVPVLVVGTTMNSLIPVTLSQTGSPLAGVALENVPITHGHTDDLRAVTKICRSFLGADVLCASSDGVICKLNSGKREAVWKLWMNGYPFICVDTNIGGDQIFLGTKDGKLVILTVQQKDMTVLETLNTKISPGAISCLKLSPDGRTVAAAGADREVHIYSLQGKTDGVQLWASLGTCKGHTNAVDVIDWSAIKLGDSHVMRTTSYLQEHKIWNVTSCAEQSAGKHADLAWASNIHDYGLILQGLQSDETADDHVTCTDVTPDLSMVAMATNQGRLRLLKHGGQLEEASSNTHLSGEHIYNICFTADGRSLLTVGGPDVCIIQWKLL